MTQKLQAVRGMNDVLPADAAAWQHLYAVAAEVFGAYGYGELRLPVVERTELFKRAVGEVTDVVEKEMYSFQDRGGENLSLRPELTAGVVRAGIEHGLLYNQQQRVWCTGPVFRYERPQAGRYRQFHQLDVEAFGIATPDIDVEVIAIAAALWRRLGVSGFTLQLNSLGTPEARMQYRAALVEYLSRYESSLDEDSKRRLGTNPLRVLDSKVPATREIVVGAPRLLDHLDAVSAAHFEAVQRGLGDLGIDYTINQRLVRGLDYYTHTVFEWTTNQLGAQDAVCAGGRYDGLVEQLGGPATPGIGFGLGIERLIALIALQQAAVPGNASHVYFCRFGAQAEAAASKLAEQLRNQQPRLRLTLNAGGGGLKSQLKRADNSGARYALILGDDEAAQSVVQVKSLRGEGDPFLCPWAELPAQLVRLLGL
ncbi:histidine--tRNA ligase [Nevskia soli]|uniref:histidine--tRNA ligase n=1 Tax=Nevskia soli TaxID=418856 RepID=UPI0004A6BD5B|nr:histidine--tRNA ligase [Nevskia soli]